MPIMGHWYDEACTLYYLTLAGRWTAEMYRDEVLIATRLLESQPHPVDVIFDLLQSGLPPLNIYSEIHAVHQQHARNLRLIVIIVPSSIVRNAVALGIRATHDANIRAEVVSSQDRAFALLGLARTEDKHSRVK